MLYGRSAECELIDDLFEAARRGRSGGLVLRGEAGIGKSVLLRYAAEQAGTARVLELRGVQAESAMPFAGLHALLYPVREHLGSLSEAQRRALSAALGLEASEVPSRFLVSAAVLELLATLAEERPVLCLVDDAQWVDPQSLGALSFALRRMRGDRLAMLFTLRVETPAEQGQAARLLADLPLATVGPLDDVAVEQVLDGRPELDRTDRAAVKEAARRNPLALTVLVPDSRADLPVAPPSLTEHLEADYLRRTAGLDSRVRHLLLLAAADDTGDLAVILAAARQQGEADLSTAEQRGLLRVDARRVDFTHPLVRSAVYQGAGSTAQREAHLALATAFAPVDPARATWHRAAAAIAPAEDVAVELADLAAAAVRRAAMDLAARAYERAAGLTTQPQRKLAWLLDAAEAAWESGHVERASGLLTGAREAATGDADPGRLDHLRGRFEAVTGSALQGYEILLQGAEAILDVAPHRAAFMLYAALRTASIAGDMDRVVQTGRVVARLLATGIRPAPACFAAGIADLLTDRGAGAVATLEEGIRAVVDTTDPEMLYMAASAAAFAGDHPQSRLLASRAASICRETGALGTLAQVLEPLVVTQIDSAPRQAEASAEEGLRAARETNQPASAAIHLAWMATVSALRGDQPATEELTDEIFALDRVHGLAYPTALAVRALGLLELGQGRPAEALLHYDSIAMSRIHRAAQLAAVDLAMLAAVWSGHSDRARTQLETIGTWPWLQEADATWAAPTVDRWRAMVSIDGEATRLYERSLAGQVDSPHSFLTALTHLLLGEHLRRSRQRSAARPHLRTAMETFERLDAVPWAARARTELRASGETVRRRDHAIRLTPQELQVAQLVATGASTKTVAAQLYLSPRTVDSHLRQIFSKLGISSRAALRDFDLAG
jgi:DNA-binding CsgD family transcriptional regulator